MQLRNFRDPEEAEEPRHRRLACGHALRPARSIHDGDLVSAGPPPRDEIARHRGSDRVPARGRAGPPDPPAEDHATDLRRPNRPRDDSQRGGPLDASPSGRRDPVKRRRDHRQRLQRRGDTVPEPSSAAPATSAPSAAAATSAPPASAAPVTVNWWHIQINDPGKSLWTRRSPTSTRRRTPTSRSRSPSSRTRRSRPSSPPTMQAGDAAGPLPVLGRRRAAEQQVDAGLVKDITDRRRRRGRTRESAAR